MQPQPHNGSAARPPLPCLPLPPTPPPPAPPRSRPPLPFRRAATEVMQDDGPEAVSPRDFVENDDVVTLEVGARSGHGGARAGAAQRARCCEHARRLPYTTVRPAAFAMTMALDPWACHVSVSPWHSRDSRPCYRERRWPDCGVGQTASMRV